MPIQTYPNYYYPGKHPSGTYKGGNIHRKRGGTPVGHPPADPGISQFVQGLYNTGKDFAFEEGVDVTDTNWNAYVFSQTFEIYVPNSTASKWITNSSNSNGSVNDPTCVAGIGAGTFDYSVGFTCSNAASAVIYGRFLADDAAAIRLNGVEVLSQRGGYSAWTDFVINSNFQAGANTLVFRVRDIECGVQTLRVEFFL